MALNSKQRKFAEQYILCGNASEAARRAGYSEKTAHAIGYENLRKPEIADVIKAIKAEYEAEFEHQIMGKYEVLARLTQIARSDIGDLLGTDMQGNIIDDVESISLKRAKEMGKSHLIKDIESYTTTTTNGEFESQLVTVKVKMYSAHEALRDLGKHHGLFVDKTEHSGADGGPIPIVITKMDVNEL
jgi:phage terminase small subunit